MIDGHQVMAMVRSGQYRPMVWALLIVLACLATGCASEGFTLQGKVVRGPIGMAEVVKADDPRLAGPPIDGASLEFAFDPRSLGREPAGQTYTRADGTFRLPIKKFGAGFLEHEMSVLARASEHRFVRDLFILPGSDKRLLVTMPRGRDSYQPPEDSFDTLREHFR